MGVEYYIDTDWGDQLKANNKINQQHITLHALSFWRQPFYPFHYIRITVRSLSSKPMPKLQYWMATLHKRSC